MIVYILSRPKDWSTRTTSYKFTCIKVKKYSFRYFKDILIEKLKGNDIIVLKR